MGLGFLAGVTYVQTSAWFRTFQPSRLRAQIHENTVVHNNRIVYNLVTKEGRFIEGYYMGHSLARTH
jgi:hypothetical protein